MEYSITATNVQLMYETAPVLYSQRHHKVVKSITQITNALQYVYVYYTRATSITILRIAVHGGSPVDGLDVSYS